jgi:Ca-activated chloride channel family protein
MRLSRIILIIASLTIVLTSTSVPSIIANAPQNQDALTYYQQGVALLTAEKFEEAVKVFSLAIKLKPDYADAYDRLGEAYSQIDEFKKALDAYKKVVRYQPNSALAYSNLGAAYANLADYKKAIEAYSEAIRLNPKAAEVHYKLGVIHAQRDKDQAAVAEYKILQALDVSLAQDLYNLIYKPTVPVMADGVVRLRVIAIDSHGTPITGLTSEDFRVVEDGAPQTVSVVSNAESSPFYGLAIDTSGSMRPIFNLVVAASKQVVERLRPENQTLLIRFVSSDKVETVQEFTSNKKLLNGGINTLYIEGGQSAVLDAVYLTAQRVGGYKFPNRNVRRVVVLLTDGDDRASYYTLDQVSALLRSIDVQIFAISFGTDSNGKLNQNQSPLSVLLLQTLTSETGGATFFPKSPAELTASINAMLAFVSGEYTIEYKPKKPPEANLYRPVSVTIVPKPQLGNSTIIARFGYTVPVK